MSVNIDNRKGVEVRLLQPFPIIKETLSRIGIEHREKKQLWPSCYIYTTRLDGKTYIAHFKELLSEDRTNEDDIKRKNTIIWLLMKWNLIDIENENIKTQITSNVQERRIFILSKKQMLEECWEIIPKVHENVLYYHIMNGMPRNDEA